MHHFDYSFLDNGMLPAGLVNITSDIYALRVMAVNRKEQFENVFTELAAVAKVQSVKCSNQIEGIVTTDDRINEIVNRKSAPLNHNEQEIAGYSDALAEVHTGYSDLDFREADILRLHFVYSEDVLSLHQAADLDLWDHDTPSLNSAMNAFLSGALITDSPISTASTLFMSRRSISS